MKTIKIEKVVPGWDFKPGQIIEIGDVNADHFIRLEFAIEIKPKGKTRKKNVTIKNGINN